MRKRLFFATEKPLMKEASSLFHELYDKEYENIEYLFWRRNRNKKRGEKKDEPNQVVCAFNININIHSTKTQMNCFNPAPWLRIVELVSLERSAYVQSP